MPKISSRLDHNKSKQIRFELKVAGHKPKGKRSIKHKKKDRNKNFVGLRNFHFFLETKNIFFLKYINKRKDFFFTNIVPVLSSSCWWFRMPATVWLRNFATMRNFLVLRNFARLQNFWILPYVAETKQK